MRDLRTRLSSALRSRQSRDCGCRRDTQRYRCRGSRSSAPWFHTYDVCSCRLRQRKTENLTASPLLTTKQLRLESSLLWVFPRLIGLKHGIEDDQHFAHAGSNGHVMMFARVDQSLVKGSNHGIAANGSERGHIQGGAHAAASATDLTLAAFVARVACKGRQARECADLLGCQAAQLGKRNEQALRGVLADAGEAFEQIGPRLIDGGGFEPLVDFLVQCRKALFQKRDRGGDVLAHLGRARAGKPVLLRNSHAHELRPAREQLGGHLALLAG